MTTLHITNGDGAAGIIKASPLKGDILPWRDTMHDGPFPAGLSIEKASALRAEYLSEQGLDEDEVRRGFELRDAHLKGAGKYEEVILWYEHDLLDQLQILQLLHWFNSVERGTTKLSMVCINQFEGITPFRGLGQLSPEQMATLHPARRLVTNEQLNLSAKGWAAFRNPNPQILAAFINSDLSALPFLKKALERHLEEYPSLKNGLSKTQNKILKYVRDGTLKPGDTKEDQTEKASRGPVESFKACLESETVFFQGDWSHFNEISRLCNGPKPLIKCGAGVKFNHPLNLPESLDEFRSQELTLTDLGKMVYANKADAVQILEIDQWFGGVHFRYDRPIWRWDSVANKLVQTSPGHQS